MHIIYYSIYVHAHISINSSNLKTLAYIKRHSHILECTQAEFTPPDLHQKCELVKGNANLEMLNYL